MRAGASRASVAVGLGEVKTGRDTANTLVAYGVGSCVIVCAWDPIARAGGMAHVVLPVSLDGSDPDGRYADHAVPMLVEQLVALGALARRLVVKLAGGAGVIGPNAGEPVGDRNVRAVEEVLARHNLRVVAADVGGSHGRTVRFDPSNGRVVVKRLGGTALVL